MGNEQSSSSESHGPNNQRIPGGKTLGPNKEEIASGHPDPENPDSLTRIEGYRVFNLFANSPAHQAGLEIYFDYIIGIDSRRVSRDQAKFFSRVCNKKGRRCKFTVFSSKTQRLRNVYITPQDYGGDGILGATIKYDIYDVEDCVNLRITQVFENSPAEMAGLEAGTDFLLGAEGQMFRDLDDLVELVQRWKGRCTTMYVYSSLTDKTRTVAVLPSDIWGGTGALGCEFGTGFLHRIPDPTQNGKGVKRSSKSRSPSGKSPKNGGHGGRSPKSGSKNRGMDQESQSDTKSQTGGEGQAATQQTQQQSTGNKHIVTTERFGKEVSYTSYVLGGDLLDKEFRLKNTGLDGSSSSANDESESQSQSPISPKNLNQNQYSLQQTPVKITDLKDNPDDSSPEIASPAKQQVEKANNNNNNANGSGPLNKGNGGEGVILKEAVLTQNAAAPKDLDSETAAVVQQQQQQTYQQTSQYKPPLPPGPKPTTSQPPLPPGPKLSEQPELQGPPPPIPAPQPSSKNDSEIPQTQYNQQHQGQYQQLQYQPPPLPPTTQSSSSDPEAPEVGLETPVSPGHRSMSFNVPGIESDPSEDKDSPNLNLNLNLRQQYQQPGGPGLSLEVQQLVNGQQLQQTESDSYHSEPQAGQTIDVPAYQDKEDSTDELLDPPSLSFTPGDPDAHMTNVLAEQCRQEKLQRREQRREQKRLEKEAYEQLHGVTNTETQQQEISNSLSKDSQSQSQSYQSRSYGAEGEMYTDGNDSRGLSEITGIGPYPYDNTIIYQQQLPQDLDKLNNDNSVIDSVQVNNNSLEASGAGASGPLNVQNHDNNSHSVTLGQTGPEPPPPENNHNDIEDVDNDSLEHIESVHDPVLDNPNNSNDINQSLVDEASIGSGSVGNYNDVTNSTNLNGENQNDSKGSSNQTEHNDITIENRDANGNQDGSIQTATAISVGTIQVPTKPKKEKTSINKKETTTDTDPTQTAANGNTSSESLPSLNDVVEQSKKNQNATKEGATDGIDGFDKPRDSTANRFCNFSFW